MAETRQKAVEVVPDKLWILYDQSGTKTGVLRSSSDDPDWLFEYSNEDGTIAHDIKNGNIDELFIFEKKTEPSSWDQEQVFGYPIPEIDIYNIQQRESLPCYTKSQSSGIFFVAGFFGINFDNGGWMESFNPKLSTLQKYEFIGPFKTELDMQLVIQRKQRNYD